MSNDRVSPAQSRPPQHCRTPPHTPPFAPLQDRAPPSLHPHQTIPDPPSPPALHITPSVNSPSAPIAYHHNQCHLIPFFPFYFYSLYLYDPNYRLYFPCLHHPYQQLMHQQSPQAKSTQAQPISPLPSPVSHSVCSESSPHRHPQRSKSSTRTSRSSNNPSPNSHLPNQGNDAGKRHRDWGFECKRGKRGKQRISLVSHGYFSPLPRFLSPAAMFRVLNPFLSLHLDTSFFSCDSLNMWVKHAPLAQRFVKYTLYKLEGSPALLFSSAHLSQWRLFIFLPISIEYW